MKKINLKPGDIVEIIDIHPYDNCYKNINIYLHTRFMLDSVPTLSINEEANKLGFLRFPGNDYYYIAIKVKKVRVLNPKKKKK